MSRISAPASTNEIILSVDEVKEMLADFDASAGEWNWFLSRIKYRELCTDWLKLRARAAPLERTS
jgi:hypothetical protein